MKAGMAILISDYLNFWTNHTVDKKGHSIMENGCIHWHNNPAYTINYVVQI